jgi:hypothetical protein
MPEAFGAFNFAYLDNPTPTLLNQIDNLYSAQFAKNPADPGYDGYYDSGIDVPGGFFYVSQNPKWLGFFWGVGRTASWTAARKF